MKIIVGLGNPGIEYENTRHNLGFRIIDHLARKLNVKLNEKKFSGLYYQEKDFLLLKSQTYMNNSGECVVEFLNYFKVAVADLLVIYDDINLPIGGFRYRSQSSGGGHNGVKDIITKLGVKNFKHLRVGIGYDPQFSLGDWVLGKFTNPENQKIAVTLPTLLTSLEEWIRTNEWEKIMSTYNRNNQKFS